jgi:hypothetical protein
MLAVAIIASVLGIRSEVGRRRETYRQLVHIWERKELLAKVDLLIAEESENSTRCISVGAIIARMRNGCVPPDVNPKAVEIPQARAAGPSADLEEYRKRLVYCRRMKQKYEHAARYPWLSVEPDPTPPGP